MGQCSSTSKTTRHKVSEERSIDAPCAEDDEDEIQLVAPENGPVGSRRRAIDEHSKGVAEASARNVLSPSVGDQSSPRQLEDYNLTALRASVDDTTRTALLALRMGRGSSVGGLVSGGGSRHSAEMTTCASSIDVKTMAPLPEDASVQDESSGGLPADDKPLCSSKSSRSYGQRRDVLKQLSRSESQDLEMMLNAGEVSRAPQVPICT